MLMEDESQNPHDIMSVLGFQVARLRSSKLDCIHFFAATA